MSHRPATTRLYGAVTPSPSHSSVARRRDRRFDLVGLELAQLVPGVDPGRLEGGVVHDLASGDAGAACPAA